MYEVSRFKSLSKHSEPLNKKPSKHYNFLLEFIIVTILTAILIVLLVNFNMPAVKESKGLDNMFDGMENFIFPVIGWLVFNLILIIRINIYIFKSIHYKTITKDIIIFYILDILVISA